MAVAGIFMKTLWKGRKDHWFSTALYLLMGWLIVLAIVPLVEAVARGGIGLAGCGRAGIHDGRDLFSRGKQLPYNHAIWHLFVLAGSVCHVLAVSRYVIG